MSRVRGEPVRQRIVDSAERLLHEGRTEFSMRELAAAAGVSFATPFNQFGGKAAIMQALSARRIERMTELVGQAPQPPLARDRVLAAVDIAVAVMVEDPAVNRAVMARVGSDHGSPGRILAHSTALWALALGGGEGLDQARRAEALDRLPQQLALGFRGALSFWTAGELTDEALRPAARAVAATLLRGYAAPSGTDASA